MSKAKKRTFKESNEFMPLSKGKLFDSDEDNCRYDWGFKKRDKPIVTENNSVNGNKPIEENNESVNPKFMYKNCDPLKLNEEDRKIYMDNLNKVYERSYVYIPAFHNVPGVVEFTDQMLLLSYKEILERELKEINETIENLLVPIDQYYINTNRLPSNCAAYKLVVTCLSQYNESKVIHENIVADFSKHIPEYKTMLKAWIAKDVPGMTNLFREIVGNVLLKYKDQPDVTFSEMAKETEAGTFMKLVSGSIDEMKERVAKAKKSRTEKETVSESEASDEEMKPIVPNASRPAPKHIIENKGIVPKRKKIDRNPRVKHRMKFKKAVVKYHSQIPRTRHDAANYEGEKSGIRAGMIRSKKFK